MLNFAPEVLHQHLLEHAPRILGFDPEAYFPEWQSAVRRTFKQLIGIMPAKVDLNVRIEQTHEHETHTEVRFVFTSEAHADVPCHLLLPRTLASAEKPPVIICLQGHNRGMHISMGRTKYAGEQIVGDRDFAVQALKMGFAALVMEIRCFGERVDQRSRDEPGIHGCNHASMTALLLGRTMVGERLWDVHRAVDVLFEKFPERVDTARIACMGNSGGGVISYYAAAFDPRIAAVMPSSSFCTYQDSIGSINHCTDNYIPNVMHYFELQDIAGLIVPRPLVLVCGLEDPIFPIAGAEKAFEDVKAIYTSQQVEEKAQLVVGPEGHRFYANLAWPVFRKLTGW